MSWTVFAIFLMSSVIVEVAAANYGVFLPLLCVCAFCFTMRFGALRVVAGLMLASAVLDGVWMHRFPSQFIGVLTVVVISGTWRRYGDLGSWLSLMVSGVCIGVISWGSHLLGKLASAGHAMTWKSVLYALPSQVAAAVILTPLTAFMLNSLLRRRIAWLSKQAEDEE